jgi:putative ABC transport system ATP-binding protein
VILAACDRVTITYGSAESAVHALVDVSLKVAEGERLALLGRSGSGKTTLLHVLGGLVEPTSGTVLWRGAPLLSLDAAARAAVRGRGIAYVFQGSNLLPYLTAFENVAFAVAVAGASAVASATGNGGATAGRPALGPHELLELVGLADKADNLPAELSGGESQRVALARAVAQRADLLLCDEPSGHLDSDTGERVLDLVDALQAEIGFALVIATHDVEVAARFPRQVELHDGRVVRDEVIA